MPHLRFRGLSRVIVKEISKTLVTTLAPVVDSPENHFVLEFIPAEFVYDGLNVAGQPLVEVLWFSRPQALQDQVAELITQALRAHLEPEQNICVIFTPLTGQQYYENGQHYG
ncbi:DUF1904 family protein [Oceanisphaera avium]|uniref:DUF1904 domain-containing protein n=1 Tax=Oceanisphaera avium TaxID=1903694 RepID=A0A1Y0CV21_9GAMM|nr:DUF1904 family protein [Oceanisphaera avium]ART78864.1 hypothetical protein CBP12_00770 [Oceanisphaera avium]